MGTVLWQNERTNLGSHLKTHDNSVSRIVYSFSAIHDTEFALSKL